MIINYSLTMNYFNKGKSEDWKENKIRRKKIIEILKKWNIKKFNNLGFCWKLSKYLDYVELAYRPGLSKIPVEKLPKIKKRRYPF